MKLTQKLKIRSFVRKNMFLYCMFRVIQHRKDKEYLEMASLLNAPKVFKRSNPILKVGNKKTYYIVKFDWKTNGFFAIMRKALSAFAIADEMGWIPYIDIQGSLFNVPKGINGTTNMFEYYFKSINEKSFKEIKASNNYIISSYLHILEINRSFGLFDDNAVYSEYLVSEQYLKYLGTISKKYFVIREELSNKIQNDIINTFPGKKVLGVHFRGTDFNAGRHGHPVIGKLTQYYNAIDEALRQGYNSIFLATDDKKVLSSFIEKYGDKICYFKDVKRSTSECGVHLQNHQEGCSGYYLGREVLRDMVALTCCDGLVAGLSQVSIFARIQKYANESHYNYLKIIDNGIHQNDSAKAKEYYGKLYQSNVIK